MFPELYRKQRCCLVSYGRIGFAAKVHFPIIYIDHKKIILKLNFSF